MNKPNKWIVIALVGTMSWSIAKAWSCDHCTGGTEVVPTTQPTDSSTYKHFGEPTKLTDADNIDAATVLADVSKYDGQFVRMTGKVTSVCKSMGCWLKMSSEGSPLTVYVSFTCPGEGDRLIPMEAVNKPAIVEGKLTVKEISQGEARHIARDEGLSDEEIEKIVGDQKQISVEGPSALVKMD